MAVSSSSSPLDGNDGIFGDERGSDRLLMYNLKTGQEIVDMEDLEAAATADQLGVCNFNGQRQLDVDNVSWSPEDIVDGGVSYPQHYASDYGDSRSAEDCLRLLVFEYGSYVVLIQGYLSPLVVLLTLINNSLTCIVLLQRNMRTPTNVCLVALAVSDALTGLVPAPAFIYFYAGGSYRTWMVPTSWCHFYPALTLHLPTVWHTTSIWLTVALAVQRYIYVKHPAYAKRLCTVPNTVRIVLGIYLAAFVSQLTCFFQFQYTHVKVEMPGSSTFDGCYFRIAPFLDSQNEIYFSIYWYMRVIFINLIPCVLLVFLNIQLYRAMRHAQIRRRQLLYNGSDRQTQTLQQQQQPQLSVRQRQSESRRLTENNAATLMLLTVVGVFLLVEFPLAVLLITMIAENHSEPLQLMDPTERRTATLFINFIILLSYPVNFFIYCGMSQQFRQTFRRLMLAGCRGGAAAATSAADPVGNPDHAALGEPTAEAVRGSPMEAAGSDRDDDPMCFPCDCSRSRALRRGSRQRRNTLVLSMVTDNAGIDLDTLNDVTCARKLLGGAAGRDEQETGLIAETERL